MPESRKLRAVKDRLARMRKQTDDAGLAGDPTMERFFLAANRRVNDGEYGDGIKNLLDGFDGLLQQRRSGTKPKRDLGRH